MSEQPDVAFKPDPASPSVHCEFCGDPEERKAGCQCARCFGMVIRAIANYLGRLHTQILGPFGPARMQFRKKMIIHLGREVERLRKLADEIEAGT